MKFNLNNTKAQLHRRWQELGRREQVLLSSVGVLVGLMGVYFLLINPLVIETFKKQRELSQLKQQLHLTQQQISTFEKHITQNIQALQSAQLIKTRTQNALPLFLDHIGLEQQQLGFTVLSVSMPNALEPEKPPLPTLQATQQLTPPSAPPPSTMPLAAGPQPPPTIPSSSSFKKIWVEVSILATYTQMGQFLESLESLPILVNVSRLTIQRQDIEKPPSIKVLFQVISRSSS